MDPSDKAVLVTGCDTGFGFALAQHLHSIGIREHLLYMLTNSFLKIRLLITNVLVYKASSFLLAV